MGGDFLTKYLGWGWDVLIGIAKQAGLGAGMGLVAVSTFSKNLMRFHVELLFGLKNASIFDALFSDLVL